jgi:tetratricopeptide (TPR) repeat protein/peroxiredoxin
MYSRRGFLNRCAQASAALIPPRLLPVELGPGTNFGPFFPAPGYASDDCSFTPRYRAKSAVDDVLLHVQPGLDGFPNEKYAAEIEEVLGEWGRSLRESPRELRGIAKFLAPDFRGSTLQPLEEHWIRREPTFEVCRQRFSDQVSLPSEAFLHELNSCLDPSARVITTEFKIPSLSVSAEFPLVIQTRIRYDLVTTGPVFYRQEHVGYWELEWVGTQEGRWSVRKWQALEETRSRATRPAFADITARALGANPSYREQLLQGSDYWRTVLDGASGIDIYGNNGVAVGDIDNDGFDDLYVCQPAGLPNRLFRNRGDGTFEDVTETSGVGVLDNATCALFADVNNDGQQDLVVVRSTGPLLFLNQGDGKFHLKPDAFHFAQPPQGTFTGASFGDYDRDGWLDIYFCLYSYYQGLDQYRYPTPYFDAQNGPPNFFLRNNRDGTFSDVTASSGLNQNNNRYSFDCAWCDFDNDGWPDLYVVNDFGRKNLYRNNQDGTFTDIAEEAGVLDIGPGMSSCWFDYDNHGRYDLYVSDMWEPAGMRVSASEGFLRDAPESIRGLFRRHAKGNSLYQNLGDGHFADRSALAGVELTGWSWSCYAWDFDHDGFPDLYIANGMISGPGRPDLESFFWRQVVSQSPLTAHSSRKYEDGWNAINDLIRSDGTWNGYQRNVFYLNNRDGTFSNVSGVVGLDFPDDSRAFALADFNHDGRLEVVLKNRTGPQVRILRNVMQGIGDSISFRLRGRMSNRDAIGAQITLETGQGRQTRFIQAGSGFASQHSKEVFFGLGKTGKPVSAEIRWPNGLVQRFENLPPNQRVEIDEGSAKFHAAPFSARTDEAESQVSQNALPLPSVLETWLIDPPQAPDFSLPDLAGNQHTLADYRGRLVLLNFWTTACAQCRQDLVFIRRNYSRWAGQGLQILAVNINKPGETEIVRAFTKEQGLAFPVLLASEDVAGVYNVLYRYMFDRRRNLGLPTSFLIDGEGFIVKVYQGPLNSDPPRLDGLPRSTTERIRRALPFPGTYYGGEFHRNYFSYGVAFSQRGYFDQAVAFFQVVVRDYPGYADAHYNLGTLYLQKKMWSKAREHLLKAVQIWPGYANALNNLGLLALDEGRPEEALGYFEDAIRQNPQYEVALENLGNLYRQLGRLEDSQQALEKALLLNPDNPEVNYGLGMVFAQKGDTERARQRLLKAVQLRPDYPVALNNLGVLYRRTGKLEEAVATFEKCIRAAPGLDQPYLNLAALYVAVGNRQKAQEVLRQLLEQVPDHALARKRLEQLTR